MPVALENGVVLVLVYGTYNHRRRVIEKIVELDERLKGRKRQEEIENEER